MPSVLNRVNEIFSSLTLSLFSVLVVFVIVDILVFGGGVITNELFSFASENQPALSVIFSFLLVVAYLMQYQNQRMQSELMEKQEQLMSAGYTPIVGVVSRKWGIEHADDADRGALSTSEANKIYLELSNNGNSTARDLRLWFGILYEDPDLDHAYRPLPVPLRRTNDGIWWPTDVGGALSNDRSTPTEFVSDPKLSKVSKIRLSSIRSEPQEEVHVHEALKELKEEGDQEVKLGIILQYRNAVGEMEGVDLAAYRFRLSTLESSDWHLYRAMEDGESTIEEVKHQFSS